MCTLHETFELSTGFIQLIILEKSISYVRIFMCICEKNEIAVRNRSVIV